MNLKEYLSRVGKSRGFGIQSPWAYTFVTEVIGERGSRHAYDNINRRYHKRKERKYQRLLYRLRKYVAPHQVGIMDITDELQPQTYHAGDALVVRNIHKDSDKRQRWEQIKQREDIGVTFDLYSFGICFFDLDIYKQHYKLNFL